MPSVSLIVLLAALLIPSTLQGASAHGERRRLQAVAIPESPHLDGVLDEPVWEKAPPTGEFRQRDPREGDPATEETIVRAAFTSESLYLGVVCRDRTPALVVATERRRDGDLAKDDSFWVLIDSFHDHRNAFLFATNPQGTQYDALIIDEGKETNSDWDEAWRVAVRQGEDAWTLEMEIPFKVLRIQDPENDIGVELQRIIRHKNEFDYWNTWDRDYKFEEVSRAGHLTGLALLKAQNQRRIKGYVVGGLGRAGDGGWENRSEVGVDDFKWRLTPGLTADLTWNTDFGEVELDSQQSNFSNPRSQLFFPEKREFFLEGAGFFDYSARMEENGNGATFRGFFSRRIGLSSGGQRIPILGGAKLTGRLGPFSIGALNMQTLEEDDVGRNNFGVLRVRRDLFSRSSVGAIVTSRSGDGSFNRTFGVDTRLVLLNNLTVDSFFVRSASPDREGDEDAYHLQGYWRSDLWDIGAGHLTLEPNFNPEMGFMRRRNTRKSIADLAFKPRPPVSWVRQIEMRTFFEYWTDQNNSVSQKIGHYILLVRFESGDSFRFAPHRRADRLVEPFELAPGVVIPPGDYSGVSYSFTYTADPSRPVAGSIRYGFQESYFGGKRRFWRIAPQWKPRPFLIMDLGYDIEKIRLPKRDFTSHILNLGVNYSLSTRLIASSVFQYNNTDRVKGANFRVNYIYRPGDDLFIVYRHTRNSLRPEFSDRALLVKFTRSFEF